MCESCYEIDIKIEHYRRLAKNITDKAALQAIDSITTDLELKKLELHPEPGQLWPRAI